MTYVVAYFKPRSDTQLEDAAQRIENRFAGQRDVRLGGDQIADAQANTQVGHDLAHAELLAFPFIFLLSLLFFRSLVAALMPPLLGGLAIVVTFFALRIVSSFVDLSVFALNFVPASGSGSRSTTACSWSRATARRPPSAASGRRHPSHARDLRPHDPVQLADGRRRDRLARDLPAAVLVLDGNRRCARRAVAAALALIVLPALLTVLGPRVNALAPKRLQRAADRDARPAQAERGIGCRASSCAAPGGSPRERRGADRARDTVRVENSCRQRKRATATASAHQVDDTLRPQFPPDGPRRSRSSSACLPLRPGQGLAARLTHCRTYLRSPGAARRPKAHHGRRAGTAGVQRPTQQLVRDIRAIRGPFTSASPARPPAYVDLEHSLARICRRSSR